MPIGKPLDYVVQYYGVPAAIGRRVVAYGKPGIIVADRGHYIGVTLDDDPKRHVSNYHPVDGIEYGEMADKLPKPPRRTNYDRYYDEEWSCAFHEFLGVNRPHREQRVLDGRKQYRMYRTRCGYSWSFADRDVEGEWQPTAALAKASYKAALKALRDGERAWRAGVYA